MALSPREKGRNQTNRSLHVERTKADSALLQRETRIERAADERIARTRASSEAARALRREAAKAHEPMPSEARRRSRAEHAEDEARAVERLVEDANLAGERHARREALKVFLRSERALTDTLLAAERMASDHDIAGRDKAIAVIAHDMASLSLGMRLNAETIAAAPVSDAGEAVRKRAEAIRVASELQSRLILDLADSAMIEQGRLKLSKALHDMREVLRSVRTALAPSAHEKRVRLAFDIPRRPLIAPFDPSRMIQVVANLVGNAVKFTPAGGSVDVSARRRGSHVEVVVRDTGVGIAPEHREHIFEMFWRGPGTKARGYGLGLYIAAQIVRAHGSKIDVAPNGKRGSVFSFRVPRRSTKLPARG